MKKYNSPEIEIVNACDVVTTSLSVETERIPFYGESNAENYQL